MLLRPKFSSPHQLHCAAQESGYGELQFLEPAQGLFNGGPFFTEAVIHRC
jgi:hypothetical protein